MLHGFHMDIVKVDRDVAYVAVVVHLRCKRLFLMFHLIFQTYVASVFILMLHMLHTYVVSVLSGCCVCVAMSFQVLHVFFCKCFRYIFQTFDLPSDIYYKCCILMFEK
jgi:hypothetical protein